MSDVEDEELMPLTFEQRAARAIDELPKLDAKDVPLEDSCPICLNPFGAILEGKVQNDGSAISFEILSLKPVELNGATKLGCGHVFCRVDLIEWITGGHGTCPACRHVFFDSRQADDSDNESSDGDYVPDEDDEYEPYTDEDTEWGTDSESSGDSTDPEEDEVDTELNGSRHENTNA